jgi:hypothetical protein
MSANSLNSFSKFIKNIYDTSALASAVEPSGLPVPPKAGRQTIISRQVIDLTKDGSDEEELPVKAEEENPEEAVGEGSGNESEEYIPDDEQGQNKLQM